MNRTYQPRPQARVNASDHPLRRRVANAPEQTWVPRPAPSYNALSAPSMGSSDIVLTAHRDTTYTGPTLVLRVLTTLLAAAVAVSLISVPVAAIVFASKFIAQTPNTTPNIPTTSRPAAVAPADPTQPAITVAANPTKKTKKAKASNK